MRLFIGERIRKREFGGEIPTEELAVIRRAIRPELLIAIRGEGLPAKARLMKGDATSPRGPRRLVCLFFVAQDDLFLLFHRPKGDPVGDSITIKNPAFKEALARQLELLKTDMVTGKVVEISLAETAG